MIIFFLALYQLRFSQKLDKTKKVLIKELFDKVVTEQFLFLCKYVINYETGAAALTEGNCCCWCGASNNSGEKRGHTVQLVDGLSRYGSGQPS